MNIKILPILLTIALSLSAAPASAGSQVYKWVDKHGKVHFTDRPNDVSVAVGSQAPSQAPAAKDESAMSRYLEKKRQQHEAKLELQQQQIAERAKKCREAGDYLERITTIENVFRIDATGNPVLLSAEQRSQAENRARQKKNQYCEQLAAAN